MASVETDIKAPAGMQKFSLTMVLVGSAGVWIFYALIARGVQEAAAINKIVTYAKIVPILTFVVVAIFALKAHVFTANFWGGEPRNAGALFGQVRATMLITVFVFLGIEGASVYSRYAKKRSDVGKATVLGFLGVLALFASVTIFSYGILPRAALGKLRQPSMAGAMESVVGTWGTAFISVGVIVSVLGAYLAWTTMSAEVLYTAAKDRDMPSFLARTTGKNVPLPALIMTSIGPGLHAAVVHHLRARHGLVRHVPPRAGPACVLPGRAGHPGRRRDRGRGRDRLPGHRRDHDLGGSK